MEVVKTVSTGRQAIEATLKFQPDCLLLDISMPDMDGLAALANIKFLDPKICVIVISALNDPCFKTRSLELGADTFFSKDGKLDELVAIIHALATEECARPPVKSTDYPIFPTVPPFSLIQRETKSSAA